MIHHRAQLLITCFTHRFFRTNPGHWVQYLRQELPSVGPPDAPPAAVPRTNINSHSHSGVTPAPSVALHSTHESFRTRPRCQLPSMLLLRRLAAALGTRTMRVRLACCGTRVYMLRTALILAALLCTAPGQNQHRRAVRQKCRRAHSAGPASACNKPPRPGYCWEVQQH